MNKGIRIAFFAPLFVIALPASPYEQPLAPQVLLEDLYADVELQGIFPDSKDFADATPRSSPPDILILYHAQKPLSPEALERFIATHFDLPRDAIAAPGDVEPTPIRKHIDDLWDRLSRYTPTTAPYSSLLPLPKPYVVPGGRFRELYYWDSYFTMLGLAESGRTDLLTDMVQNFAHQIDAYGHMPNGTGTY